MSYHPRIESKDLGSFLTTRSRNSELWFVNNNKLQQSILGYAAKFSKRYNVKLYALAIEGNHIQAPAFFPQCRRADFMRDFNSCVARAVTRYTPQYRGGTFWARRYSAEFLPGDEDIEEYFFYTVLQPVQDGLVEKISDYPGYNCFNDAIWGIKKKFKVINWAKYNAARRFNSKIAIKSFTEEVTLEYERLPGYEELSQAEYAKRMLAKLESRRQVLVAERYRKGLGFVGREKIITVRPGSVPKSSKTSTIYSHRPRVLSICSKRRAECQAWYFDVYFLYQDASAKYRAGDLYVVFPEGTYRPYLRYKPPESAFVY